MILGSVNWTKAQNALGLSAAASYADSKSSILEIRAAVAAEHGPTGGRLPADIPTLSCCP